MSPAIDSALLALLACPCPSHGPLEAIVDETQLRCLVCGRVYPIRDGIPVLLLSEAISKPSNEAPTQG